MRRRTRSAGPVAGLCLMALAAPHIPAQRAEDPPTISTSGRGAVAVLPDSVRVSLGVQTQAEKLPDARAQNAREARAVMEAVEGLGLDGLAIKSVGATVSFVWPEFGQGRQKLKEALGYRVTHRFTVRVADDSPDDLSSAAAKIVDTAVDAGANMLDSVSFFREDVSEAQREALTRAVAVARENAEAIARGLGVEIAGVRSVSGSPRYGQVTFNQRGDRQYDEASNATPFVAGEIVISCEVRLTATFSQGQAEDSAGAADNIPA